MKNMEITCPYCGNNEHIKKNGHYNGKQRYKCSKCGKTFTTSNIDRRIKHPVIMRKLAVSSYLHGMSLSSIQRVLSLCFGIKLSFNLINNWIKSANNILEQEKKEREEKEKHKPKTIEILEMDELYTYVKKNPKIQKENHIMINEYGLLWIGAEEKLLHLR